MDSERLVWRHWQSYQWASLHRRIVNRTHIYSLCFRDPASSSGRYTHTSTCPSDNMVPAWWLPNTLCTYNDILDLWGGHHQTWLFSSGNNKGWRLTTTTKPRKSHVTIHYCCMCCCIIPNTAICASFLNSTVQNVYQYQWSPFEQLLLWS
jgi:hypothetical protein